MKRFLFIALLFCSVPVQACEVVTVAWTPPTENTDGSPLTTLDGFRLYYIDSVNDTYTVEIADPLAVQHVLPCVELGDAIFEMTAYVGTVESSRSAPVQFTVKLKGGLPIPPVILGIT